MRAVVFAAALVLIANGMTRAQMAQGPQADEYPIIAQLLNDPNRYIGKSIVIYGLVVEGGGGSSFMLQDVSQRPLKVVGENKIKAAVGDQVLIFGFFHPDAQTPYFSARTMIPTRVLGGGGCC